MDDETKKEFAGLLQENNKDLAKSIVEALKPVEPEKKEVEPEKVETKQIDEDKLADKIRKGILKDLGIEPEEPEKEQESGIMVLTKSALEDLQSDAVQKALLAIGNQRQGERKSKSIGGNKFEIPKTEPPQDETKDLTGKVGTRKAAEMAAGRLGLIKAA